MSDDLTHYMEATAQLHKGNEILATAVEMNGRRVAELEAERDRLRAVVEAAKARIDRMFSVLATGRFKDPASHYAAALREVSILVDRAVASR